MFFFLINLKLFLKTSKSYEMMICITFEWVFDDSGTSTLTKKGGDRGSAVYARNSINGPLSVTKGVQDISRWVGGMVSNRILVFGSFSTIISNFWGFEGHLSTFNDSSKGQKWWCLWSNVVKNGKKEYAKKQKDFYSFIISAPLSSPQKHHPGFCLTYDSHSSTIVFPFVFPYIPSKTPY